MQSLSNTQVQAILNEMTPDDRTRLLEELPAEVTRRLLEDALPRGAEGRARSCSATPRAPPADT